MRKERNGDICKGTLDIEFERDWSFGLGAYVRRHSHRFFFFSFRDFSGKPNIVIFLGFIGILNPQNLMKFVGAIFEKIEI